MRTARGIAAAMVAALSLAACGGDGSGGGDDSKIELTYLHPYSWVDDSLFEQFRKENPNIELTVQQTPPGDAHKKKVRTLLSTDDLPDVMAIPGGADAQDLVEKGALVDLTDALGKPAYGGGPMWGETFQDGILDLANETMLAEELYAGGEQYFVPAQVISIAAIYNKELYDKVGIEPPETWEAFVDNNRKLKEAGYIPLSLIGETFLDWWLKMAWDQTARGVTREDLESGKVSWTDPRLIEGVRIVQDLYKQGFFPKAGLSNGIEEGQALFISGKMGHFVTVAGQTAKYVVEKAPFEVGAFPLPGAKGVEPVRSMGGAVANVGVSASTEHPEAAIKLLKYITSEDFFAQTVDRYVTPPLDMEVESNEIVSAFVEASSGGFVVAQSWFQSLDAEPYDAYLTEIVPAAYRGETSARGTMERIAALFEE